MKPFKYFTAVLTVLATILFLCVSAVAASLTASSDESGSGTATVAQSSDSLSDSSRAASETDDDDSEDSSDDGLIIGNESGGALSDSETEAPNNMMWAIITTFIAVGVGVIVTLIVLWYPILHNKDGLYKSR